MPVGLIVLFVVLEYSLTVGLKIIGNEPCASATKSSSNLDHLKLRLNVARVQTSATV
jgi:hypothetical protein